MNYEKVDCRCPKVECPRHDQCEECREHHDKKGDLPFCEREDREQVDEIESGAKQERRVAPLERRHNENRAAAQGQARLKRGAGPLERLSSWLYRITSGYITIAVTLLFILFMALVLPHMAGRLTALTGVTVSPDTSFLYTAEALYAMAEAYGAEGRAYYIYSRFTFDVVWPVVYLLFFTFIITFFFRHLPSSSPWRAANLLPLAGALFDVLENSAASLVMFRYPLPTPVIAQLAPVFTFFKWTLIGLCFIALLIGLGINVYACLNRKNRLT